MRFLGAEESCSAREAMRDGQHKTGDATLCHVFCVTAYLLRKVEVEVPRFQEGRPVEVALVWGGTIHLVDANIQPLPQYRSVTSCAGGPV